MELHRNIFDRKITLILADDHEIVRVGLKRFLSFDSNIDIIAEASNGEDAITFVTELEPDIVLLDNMSPAQLREAVEQIGGRAKTEASGGIRLDSIREIAETGVDFISIGALTHSARSVDIGMDFEPAEPASK